MQHTPGATDGPERSAASAQGRKTLGATVSAQGRKALPALSSVPPVLLCHHARVRFVGRPQLLNRL